MIKLLTFDLDNTLWSVDPIIARAENAMMEWIYKNQPELRFKVTTVQFEQYKDKLSTEQPHISHDLTQLRLTTLRKVLEGHVAGDVNSIVAKAYEVFQRERNIVQYFPYVLETLEELAEQFPLIALSNGNADVHKVGIGHLFKHHFSAASVGFAKPHPAMFQHALAAAKVAAHETIHIGDHPVQDIQAAKDIGMKTIWVNWMSQAWPLACKPDAVVNNFEDLPDAISSLTHQLETS
ncbi:MAG: HAD family hydrolase [Moraxellaceae bacterium]|nr:HAD family hydrolase [Pseudomonadales bacterium]MCB1674312.1 HAD family hydrolase [Pseudomonadales bacterium]MCP5173592.1 HAD family hydrolase [Moraxellaceae bacterium]MCP5177595.1 HAD family hydrolase [Moraxellaceae bacterium]HQV22089.1 HAD family hydrolase [Agitococcus sp.]